jgi:hypothetical protein
LVGIKQQLSGNCEKQKDLTAWSSNFKPSLIIADMGGRKAKYHWGCSTTHRSGKPY